MFFSWKRGSAWGSSASAEQPHRADGVRQTAEERRVATACAHGVRWNWVSGQLTPRRDRLRIQASRGSAVAQHERSEPVAATDDLSSERFYHGTRADLKPGDLIEAGRTSNYGKRNTTTYVYLTGTLDAATWGAELALGEGPGRIYVVEPTGPIMDDPNLTDKKYPGNPTKSYRSREPLRVTGEVTDWQGHSPETIQAMKDGIKGLEPIDD